ncbi:MAG: hypothetical protein CR955_00235 [Thiotrichales bacterium]|nr:MAG: hypothetical protein CR955_00235 [Thiotrichales bacterium]
MNYRYPGSNTHLENHHVNEESFWPSFTDVMMVIVMVFLLVTVAVILNNWTLISELKASINAQHIASDLAKNRQEKNQTLATKLTSLEKQLETLHKQYEVEKSRFVETKQELSSVEQNLADKSSLLTKTETQLKTLTAENKATKSALVEAQDALKLSQEKLLSSEDVNTQNESLIATLKKDLSHSVEENQKLTEIIDVQKEKIAVTLDQEKVLSEKLLASEKSLKSLQSDHDSLDDKYHSLTTDMESANKALEKERETSKALQEQSAALQGRLKEVQTKKKEQGEVEQTLLQKLNEKTNELTKLASIAEESRKLLKVKEEQIVALKEKQKEGDSQLRSLQGEYDTLDSKYQKLLRPARSSKGKYIASVTYKKIGGKRVIRFKSSPSGSYKTVTRQELAKSLEALKKKHKKNLYIKVVIPENSGLSYNEAWKFTSNLQKKYDYYFQR